MNIEDERKEKNMVCFAVIKVGQVFQFDDNIYMKIDVDSSACNAINLLNGTGLFLMPDSKVILLDAKVVIQNDI